MKPSLQRHHPKEIGEAQIESLAQDGRGVAHLNGKAVFIHGALPGEMVRFVYDKVQKHFAEATTQEVLRAATERVSPHCAHFGICGGCSLQHLEASAQIGSKERVLQDVLIHIAKVQPTGGYLSPLVARHWGYRSKARLGAKYVNAKARLLVGFRERGSTFVTDLTSCAVLHPKIGQRVEILRETLSSLTIRTQIPQIEVAIGDTVCVLVLRILAPLTANDQAILLQFANDHDLTLYLQPGGPDSVIPLHMPADLYYDLPQIGLRLRFLPLDFTQVHMELNRLLVARVLELLDPQPQHKILDLFCGIGNFTLPLATRANTVVGVEGDAGLVARATSNAKDNGLSNCKFYTTDLYSPIKSPSWLAETFDLILLDPPRSGAAQVLPYLPKLGASRILYISCLPSTLARDAGALVHEFGYTMRYAGVMDMFPHTAHVESMALFER